MTTPSTAQEIERLTRALERAKAERDVARATRVNDALFSRFSHDLRNPLGAIASAVEVLHRIGGQKPDEVHAREVIRRQVRHLTRMVDDVVDAAQVLDGNVKLSRAPVDLAAAVRRALAAADLAKHLGDHQVETDLSSAWIHADGQRVEQIAAALLGNAARFTPPGGVISVKVRTEGAEALLSVSDTGIGIAPDRLGHVFNPFVRDERRSSQHRGGLGLGLAIVKRLTELHGGSIAAFSDGADRGSRFEARFPAVEARA